MNALQIDYSADRKWNTHFAVGTLSAELAEGKISDLVTVAAIFSNPDPTKLGVAAQSIVHLALYAAGAAVALSREQLETLFLTVQAYQETMTGYRQDVAAVVKMVVRKASERAQAENLA